MLAAVKPRRLYMTRAWLNGPVDEECFPGVHSSYSRREALNLPRQAFCPPPHIVY